MILEQFEDCSQKSKNAIWGTEIMIMYQNCFFFILKIVFVSFTENKKIIIFSLRRNEQFY